VPLLAPTLIWNKSELKSVISDDVEKASTNNFVQHQN
jgi:hypothetical protein